MAKLNQVKKPQQMNTLNKENFPSYSKDDKTTLYTMVCACMWNEPTFYCKDYDEIINLVHKIGALDPVWVAKLAAYARDKMNLRTVSVVVLCELAAIKSFVNKPKPWIVEWGQRVILRADEICEALSYFTKKYGKKVPKSLKNLIAIRLNALTEYEATKYSGKKDEWSLHDAINFIHPIPKDEKQEALFGYIIGNKNINMELLPMIKSRNLFLKQKEWNETCSSIADNGFVTWETAISKFGNIPQVWDSLSLPIMAGVRNIRNIIECGADLTKIINKLNNSKIILNSKLFPYRFYMAYKIVNEMGMGHSHIAKALDNAMKTVSESIRDLSGKTLICVDHSGSMDMGATGKSKISLFESASCMATILSFSCEDNKVSLFGETCQYVNLKSDSFIDRIETMHKTDVGHSTNAYKPISKITKDNEHFDRIIILSDMQCYGAGYLQNELEQYRKNVNNNVKLISIDMVGYAKDTPFKASKNVLQLAGFSEKMFEVIEVWEKSIDNGINIIDTYK